MPTDYRQPIIVPGVGDITQLHRSWQGSDATIPGGMKTACWWHAYHCVTVEGKRKAACNLCGHAVNCDGTSAIKRHLLSCGKPTWLYLVNMPSTTEVPSFSDQERSRLTVDEINYIYQLKNALPPPVSARPPRTRKKKTKSEPSGSTATTSTKRKGLPLTRAGSSHNSAAAADVVMKQQAPPPAKKARGGGMNHESKVLDAHARFVAAAFLKPTDVETREFRNLLSSVQQGGVSSKNNFIVSAEMVENKIKKLAALARARLQELVTTPDQQVDQPVVLSIHHWMSRDWTVCRSLQAHWMHAASFTSRSAVLSVDFYKHHHATGGNYSPMDLYCTEKLQEFGLNWDQVALVVVDKDKESLTNVVQPSCIIDCLDSLLQEVATVALQEVLGTDDTLFESLEDDGTDEEEDHTDRDREGDFDEATILREARRIIRYFGQSPRSLEKLDSFQPPETRQPIRLVEDVCTTWWSTLPMLKCLLKLQAPITSYYESEGDLFPPTLPKCRAPRMLAESEWSLLQTLVNVLAPLEAAQEIYKADSFVSAATIPFILFSVQSELVSLQTDSRYQEDVLVKQTAANMLHKFSETFGDSIGVFPGSDGTGQEGKGLSQQNGLNRAILLAHVLDPRFKSLVYIAEANREKLWDTLLEEMVRLGPPEAGKLEPEAMKQEEHVDFAEEPARLDMFSKYASMLSPVAYAAPEPEEAVHAIDIVSKYASMLSTSQSHSEVDSAASGKAQWRNLCNAELMSYQSEKQHCAFNANPLLWWKEHSIRYPNLWRLAQVYLVIPAVSHLLNTAFSIPGNLSTVRRCRLSSGSQSRFPIPP